MNAELSLLVGGVLGFFASLLANVVTGPVISMTSRHLIIQLLSKIPFSSDRRFAGTWRVVWTVDSPGYSATNEGKTEISSFLSSVAFAASSQGYGTVRTYLYVGHSKGGIISGRWYDPDGSEAYYGMFQMRLNGTLQTATGKWIGWAIDGTVKEGDLTLQRL